MGPLRAELQVSEEGGERGGSQAPDFGASRGFCAPPLEFQLLRVGLAWPDQRTRRQRRARAWLLGICISHVCVKLKPAATRALRPSGPTGRLWCHYYRTAQLGRRGGRA